MHATICSEETGDLDGGGGKLAVMWSMQSAMGRPSASMPAMTPAAAETIDVWQLKGLRTAPASAEKTFVVPATRDEPSTRGIPPAQCHPCGQAATAAWEESREKPGVTAPHDAEVMLIARIGARVVSPHLDEETANKSREKWVRWAAEVNEAAKH